MTNSIAAVKFEDTKKPYYFACDLTGLNFGEPVKVQTEKAIRTATFLGYTQPEIIGFTPEKKVVGRVTQTTTFYGTRGTRRTKQQIAAESRELYKQLKLAHPIQLSLEDIAEVMNWDLDSVSSFVKTAMEYQPKIIRVKKGWYTV